MQELAAKLLSAGLQEESDAAPRNNRSQQANSSQENAVIRSHCEALPIRVDRLAAKDFPVAASYDD